jgi:hypothetical protein
MEGSLHSYRFCFHNAKGKFTGAVSCPFADDGAALRYARRQLTVHHVVEVWRGELRMALLDARITRSIEQRKPPLRII